MKRLMGWLEARLNLFVIISVGSLCLAPFMFFAAMHSYQGQAASAALGLGLGFLIAAVITMGFVLLGAAGDFRAVIIVPASMILCLAMTALAFSTEEAFMGAVVGLMSGVVVAVGERYDLFAPLRPRKRASSRKK